MSSRSLNAVLAFAFGGIVLGTGCAERRPPDVVLIVVDTLRASSVSSYGNPRPTTPALDAMASDGIRYERAYSQAPWTSASIGSLLASQYPTSLGLRDLDDVLPPEPPLLSEVFAAAGYTTGAVVSHVLCGAGWGFDRGFHTFDESNAGGHDSISSEQVTANALRFVTDHPDEPLFLFVHYFDPHYAYIEHPDLMARQAPYGGRITSGAKFMKLRRRRAALTPADVSELLRLYHSEVAFTDRSIGHLLDGLRDAGRYQDALILVTADHGEEFLEHGDLGHIDTLFEELVRVPLIVKLPGAPAEDPVSAPDRVIETPVSLLDVAPTVVDLAGLARPAAWRGRPLPATNGESRTDPVFTETSNSIELRAVIDGRHKLIVDLNRGTSALFDLETDPGERHDLAAAQPALRDRLRARLDAWLAAHPPPGSPASRELRAEESEQLRALGYH